MPITITTPDPDQEFDIGSIVSFEGTADSSITQVELWADDRWLLGTSPVTDQKWSLSYSFKGAGTRSIHARGLDASKTVVAQDHIWVFIGASLDLNQNLTPNFTLKELTRSSTAIMLILFRQSRQKNSRIHPMNLPNTLIGLAY